jgi:hypothetical protein
MTAIQRLFSYVAQPASPQSHAERWPVWRDSTRLPVRFAPMSRKQMAIAIERAEDFERNTRQPGRQDGAVSRNGLAVLRAFRKIVNYTTGRLDPSIATIARWANISVRSVLRGLAKLRAAGLVTWQRRCSESIEGGRFTLRQESNAYAIQPDSHWRGYRAPPPPPPPHALEWGARPALPPALQATAELRGASRDDVLRVLESDPDKGGLAAALARLGRALT